MHLSGANITNALQMCVQYYLAIGYFPDLRKSGFYQQQLFESTFVCISRKKNRRLDKRGGAAFSLSAYTEAAHVVVHFEGRSQELMDRHLAQLKIDRKIMLTVPHFMTLLEIIPQSGLIATVPRELALQIAKSHDIAIHALPFEAPRFALKQFWHKRNHDDPANRWLRGIVRGTFQPSIGE